jgi:predicted short-subunit dehydrogenase-like oxidoreductase (DUF2520 family)
MIVRGGVFVVGAGRVGTALALGLQRAGLPVVGLWTRDAVGATRVAALTGLPVHHGPFPVELASAEIVLLSVPDPVVRVVAGALLDGGLLRSAPVVLHCGGGHPAGEALGVLASAVSIGTLHPLLAIADPVRGAAWLARSIFVLEGDERACAVGRSLVEALGARHLTLPAGALRLYHAAAVMASNHGAALIAAATELLTAAGVDPSLALPALLPLVASTLENLEALGPAEALTGPVRRGDPATVEAHLEAIAHAAPQHLALYAAGTRAAAALASTARRPPDVGAITAILANIDKYLK